MFDINLTVHIVYIVFDFDFFLLLLRNNFNYCICLQDGVAGCTTVMRHGAGAMMRARYRQTGAKFTLTFIPWQFCVEAPHYSLSLSLPRVDAGIVRIDPLSFLAGCCKRRLNQVLFVLSLSLGYF